MPKQKPKPKEKDLKVERRVTRSLTGSQSQPSTSRQGQPVSQASDKRPLSGESDTVQNPRTTPKRKKDNRQPQGGGATAAFSSGDDTESGDDERTPRPSSCLESTELDKSPGSSSDDDRNRGMKYSQQASESPPGSGQVSPSGEHRRRLSPRSQPSTAVPVALQPRPMTSSPRVKRASGGEDLDSL